MRKIVSIFIFSFNILSCYHLSYLTQILKHKYKLYLIVLQSYNINILYVIQYIFTIQYFYAGLKDFLVLQTCGNKQLSQSGFTALQIYLPNKTIA
jgi:hypothetical protein